MPRYVEDGVADLRDNPSNGKVTLVVGISAQSSESVESRIQRVGGDIEERLPFDSLQVTISESDLSGLCSVEGIESIEFDEGMEILAGN